MHSMVVISIKSKKIQSTIVIVVSLLLVFLCIAIQSISQNSTDSLKTDSLFKANQINNANAGKGNIVSQKVDTRPLLARVGFDLNTSFWVNTYSTFFEFSPVIVYHFPKTYSTGGGPTYVYNHNRLNKTNVNGWGGKVFGRAQLANWLYAATEYQGISSQYISGVDLATGKITKSKTYVPSLFFSAGINLRLTKRNGINLQLLYDVLHDNVTSPYLGQWTYRLGFGF